MAQALVNRAKNRGRGRPPKAVGSLSRAFHDEVELIMECVDEGPSDAQLKQFNLQQRAYEAVKAQIEMYKVDETIILKFFDHPLTADEVEAHRLVQRQCAPAPLPVPIPIDTTPAPVVQPRSTGRRPKRQSAINAEVVLIDNDEKEDDDDVIILEPEPEPIPTPQKVKGRSRGRPPKNRDPPPPKNRDPPYILPSGVHVQGESTPLPDAITPQMLTSMTVYGAGTKRSAAFTAEEPLPKKRQSKLKNKIAEGLQVTLGKDKPTKAMKKKEENGNWVPLDEYYYSKQEGDPVYREEKGEFRFKCWYCHKMLYNNVRIMMHMQSHIDTDKQQHLDLSDLTQCKHCYKQFDTPFEMQNHIERVHQSTSNVLICRICEKDHDTQTSLRQHMKGSHNTCEMPYICQLCNFRSSVYNDVVDHFKKRHDSSHFALCLYCLKVFKMSVSKTSGWALTSQFYHHLQKHQIKSNVKKCSCCKLSFINKAEAKSHKQRDHLPNFRGAISGSSKKGKQSASGALVMIKVPKLASDKKIKSLNAPIISKVQLLHGLIMHDVKASHLCFECRKPMTEPDHYKKYIECSLCRYATTCCFSYSAHMIGFHSGNPQTKWKGLPRERDLPQMWYCLCGYYTNKGNSQAYHLVTCSKRTAYSKVPQRKFFEYDDELEEFNPFEPYGDEGENNYMSSPEKETPSLFGALGLVRKSDRRSSYTRKELPLTPVEIAESIINELLDKQFPESMGMVAKKSTSGIHKQHTAAPLPGYTGTASERIPRELKGSRKWSTVKLKDQNAPTKKSVFVGSTAEVKQEKTDDVTSLDQEGNDRSAGSSNSDAHVDTVKAMDESESADKSVTADATQEDDEESVTDAPEDTAGLAAYLLSSSVAEADQTASDRTSESPSTALDTDPTSMETAADIIPSGGDSQQERRSPPDISSPEEAMETNTNELDTADTLTSESASEVVFGVKPEVEDEAEESALQPEAASASCFDIPLNGSSQVDDVEDDEDQEKDKSEEREAVDQPDEVLSRDDEENTGTEEKKEDGSDDYFDKIEAVEDKGEKIEDTRDERIEDKSEMIENKSDEIEDKSEKIEDKSDEIEFSSEKIEDTSEMIEDKSTAIEDNSEIIEDTNEIMEDTSEKIDDAKAEIADKSEEANLDETDTVATVEDHDIQTPDAADKDDRYASDDCPGVSDDTDGMARVETDSSVNQVEHRDEKKHDESITDRDDITEEVDDDERVKVESESSLPGTEGKLDSDDDSKDAPIAGDPKAVSAAEENESRASDVEQGDDIEPCSPSEESPAEQPMEESDESSTAADSPQDIELPDLLDLPDLPEPGGDDETSHVTKDDDNPEEPATGQEHADSVTGHEMQAEEFEELPRAGQMNSDSDPSPAYQESESAPTCDQQPSAGVSQGAPKLDLNPISADELQSAPERNLNPISADHSQSARESEPKASSQSPRAGDSRPAVYAPSTPSSLQSSSERKDFRSPSCSQGSSASDSYRSSSSYRHESSSSSYYGGSSRNRDSSYDRNDRRSSDHRSYDDRSRYHDSRRDDRSSSSHYQRDSSHRDDHRSRDSRDGHRHSGSSSHRDSHRDRNGGSQHRQDSRHGDGHRRNDKDQRRDRR